VRAVCAEQGVRYQGFSLLTANRDVWGGPVVARIARSHGCTPAQVIFRLALALDILPLTGTTDPRHLASDLASFDLDLGEADLAALGA
jgi:diketogulonate reductase-like aldo/keto reductase